MCAGGEVGVGAMHASVRACLGACEYHLPYASFQVQETQA